MRTRVAVALGAIAFLAAACGGGGEEAAPTAHSVRARVVRVIDGDTIEVSIDGADEDVRYIGIDTPETVKPGTPVECYGPRASAENHRLVEGRTVRLVFDRERRDAYGRLLAYVYIQPSDRSDGANGGGDEGRAQGRSGKARAAGDEGRGGNGSGGARGTGGTTGRSRFVNAELVRKGYARTLTIEPNTAHTRLFSRLESQAGQAGRGLWGSC